MVFLKKLLVILFLLLSIGFFFYVFYTQVFTPLKHPPGETPQTVSLLPLVKGYLDTLYKLFIEPLSIRGV